MTRRVILYERTSFRFHDQNNKDNRFSILDRTGFSTIIASSKHIYNEHSENDSDRIDFINISDAAATAIAVGIELGTELGITLGIDVGLPEGAAVGADTTANMTGETPRDNFCRLLPAE